MTNILDFNQARRQGEAPRTDVDVQDIRARLHANPRSFVDWLFSGRAFIGRNEARIGNTQGQPGASLSIALSGKDAGLWRDHATGEGGDLIELYRASMGYAANQNFVLSLKEIAKEYFGDPVEVERAQWQPTALERIEKKKATLGTKPRADMLELGAPVATYPYYDLYSKIIASVVRYEPDGTRENKTFRPYCYKTVDGTTKWIMGAPELRPLYRLPEIALAPTVVLCEGEGCATALASIGIAATTAMQGAKAPVEKTDWSPLHGKTVIVWPDNDDPGLEYGRKVAARLIALGCAVRFVQVPVGKPSKWDAADCVAEGGDPHLIIGSAISLQDTPRPRIRILDIDEIEALEPPRWLIENTLTTNGLSILWGRSGAMKSFVALDMALCIATGIPWHGKAVVPGLVVYVAAEGAYGLGRRAVGWRRSRGLGQAKPRFKLIPHPVALSSDDLGAMIEAVLKLNERPVLVILDTLARTFGAGDENKQADMNAYVTAADKLREATGANVMIIHHSGVHEERRERGSNVLRGAADTVIKISRKGDKLDIINEAPEGKQKDAEEFKTIKLRTQKVHFSQADQEQSTLILNLRDEDEPEPDGKGEKALQPEGCDGIARLTKNQKAVLAALKKAKQPLGFMRLMGMTSLSKSSIHDALVELVEREIARTTDPHGRAQQWEAIQ
jgi:hypothetical protein